MSKPFKMFLIVPLGLLHMDLRLNSLTLASSAIEKIKKTNLMKKVLKGTVGYQHNNNETYNESNTS